MSFFSRLFGKKPESSSSDGFRPLSVENLRKHWKFDYNGREWKVTDMAIYTWDNGVKDSEWTVKSGKSPVEYLNYESVSGNISIYKEHNMNSIWKEAKKFMRNDDMDDKVFEFEGREYAYLDEGFARVRNSEETYTMSNWLFSNSNKSYFVSFNKYEDGSMDSYIGEALSPTSIRNIQYFTVK